MSEEHRKILEMLNSGKITVDDAERLLAAIGGKSAESEDREPEFQAKMEGFVDRVRKAKAEAKAAKVKAKAEVKAVMAEAKAGREHAGGSGRQKPFTPNYLRVTVQSSSGDNVNVKVPINLIRAGMKFQGLMSFVPESAREQINAKLGEKGIDIDLGKIKSQDLEEILQALGELEVNVDSDDGDRVRVFCE